MTAGSVYRYDPVEPPEPDADQGASDHSRAVALALAVVGGVFGLHRFYSGRVHSGVWMCLTLGGLGMWYLYDIIVIAAGDFRDGAGRRLSRWEVSEAAVGPGAAERRVTDVEDRLLSLETRVSELAERLDFAERLLAQAREKGTLPKG